jgi:hypothetical protein
MIADSVSSLAMAAVAALSFFLGSAVSAGETSLRMTSDTGEILAGGASYQFTPADGTFAAQKYGAGIYVTFTKPAYSDYWSFIFQPPSLTVLVPGVYENALETASPTRGAMVITRQSVYASPLTGLFEVKEIAFGQNGEVLSFWIVFEYHDVLGPPALRGDLRYSADTSVALSVPLTARTRRGVPLTIEVNAAQALGERVKLFAEGLPIGASFSDHGDSTGTLSWTPPEDAALDVVPILFSGAHDGGGADQVTTFVEVRGSTRLVLRSDAGDFVGGGLTYSYEEPNGLFFARIYENSLQSEFYASRFGGDTWSLMFDAPNYGALLSGLYHDAVRWPSLDSGHPGLDVYGMGRGCNWLSGEFEIRQVTAREDPLRNSFWATFVQHCEGAVPALRGEMQLNADVHGDANGDGSVDVLDIFFLINRMFAHGPALRAPCDVNADGVTDISDIFYLINHLFAGGPRPI